MSPAAGSKGAEAVLSRSLLAKALCDSPRHEAGSGHILELKQVRAGNKFPFPPGRPPPLPRAESHLSAQGLQASPARAHLALPSPSVRLHDLLIIDELSPREVTKLPRVTQMARGKTSIGPQTL